MFRIKMALLTAVLAGLASSTVQAGLMPVSATMTAETGSNSYNYDIGLQSGTLLKAGDYFTIYDVAGYTSGSAATPAGWTLTSSTIGLTPPNVSPIDSSGVNNLTFSYTGATTYIPGGNVGGFTFLATSTPIPTYFASLTHTGNGGLESNVTSITPTTIAPRSPNNPTGGSGGSAPGSGSGSGGGSPQTPEPASLLLLGMVVPFAGIRRWLSRTA